MLWTLENRLRHQLCGTISFKNVNADYRVFLYGNNRAGIMQLRSVVCFSAFKMVLGSISRKSVNGLAPSRLAVQTYFVMATG